MTWKTLIWGRGILSIQFIPNRETQKEIVNNCKSFIIRDLCVSTMQRVVEHAIVEHTDEHFSSKMFKSTFKPSLLTNRCKNIIVEEM